MDRHDLRYEDPHEVAMELDANYNAGIHELRAALANAMVRISGLEDRLERIDPIRTAPLRILEPGQTPPTDD